MEETFQPTLHKIFFALCSYLSLLYSVLAFFWGCSEVSSLFLEVSDEGKRHLNGKEIFPWCWFRSFRQFRYEFCWVLFFGSVPVILITEIMTPIFFSPI